MIREIHNRPSRASGPSRAMAVNLKTIWDVCEDSSYDARCDRPIQHVVTIRTRAGAGELHVEGRTPIAVGPDSLISLELPRLRRYRCTTPPWTFWWFEYDTSDPFPTALHAPYPVKGTACDERDLQEAFTKLQHPAAAHRAIASATFSLMLHRWFAEIRQQNTPSPHRGVIDTIIDRIHADLSADWSLPRLTAAAGLGETLFRREFKAATGLTPARFIRQARLQAAAQMIEQETYTLAAIAEQLNFSSSFHLSTAFKQHFGIRPAQIRTPPTHQNRRACPPLSR
jgi:AraC-like DNA-binding protein